MKSEDPLHKLDVALSRPLLIVLLLVMGGVSVWTLTHETTSPALVSRCPIYTTLRRCLCCVGFSVWLWRSVKNQNPMRVHGSHARVDFSGVQRVGHQHLPNIIPPGYFAVCRRRAAAKSKLYAGWGADNHPGLFWLIPSGATTSSVEKKCDMVRYH